MAVKIQNYDANGVAISKSPIYVGDEVTITYDGLLAKSGADKVFAYIGYGEAWEEKGFIPMTYEFDVFKATFKVLAEGNLNIAFKDSAENWDNNSTENYIYKVAKKQRAEKAAPGKKAGAKAESGKAAKAEVKKQPAEKKAAAETAGTKKKTVRKKQEAE